MRTSLIGAATFVVMGCASQPPAKLAAIDPSSPSAAEAPAPTLTPLVGARADTRAEEPAPATPPTSGGHQHQGDGDATPEAAAPTPSRESPQGERAHEHGVDNAQPKKAVTYTCPMHPEISPPKPGKCPKCGMTLVPRTADSGSGGRE